MNEIHQADLSDKTPDQELSQATSHENDHACCQPQDPATPDVVKGDESREVQRTLYRQFVYAVMVLFLLMGSQWAAITWLDDPRLNGLLGELGPWILFLNVTVVFLVATIGYVRLYRYSHLSCMNGMMVGMSIGMQVGMMMGAIFGGADGYFIGCMMGVLLGAGLGVSIAWCCGPVGITQGLMSGLMGGTMGAMVIVMMPSSKVMIFMTVFTAINLAVLLGFCAYFARDAVIGERCSLRVKPGFFRLLGSSLVLITVLTALMVGLAQ